MKNTLLHILLFYKNRISPILVYFMGHSCRFNPTCSEYAYQAIEKYGILKGALLTMKRIARCHPFSKYGYDPVSDGA